MFLFAIFRFFLDAIRRNLHGRRRGIFRYWDGSRMRGADPIAVFRALRTHPTFDAERHLPAVERGDLSAIPVTLEAVREVFGVRAWSEESGGLTEQETLSLVADFGAYLESLKKSGSPSPTWPGPTDSEPSSEAESSDLGSGTNATSDSGPTRSESVCADPVAS